MGKQIRRSVLAHLERANISCNPPTVVDSYTRCVAVHSAISVCHDVEKVPYRRIDQSRVVIAGRLPQATEDDHAAAIPQPAMAGRTVDVESLLAAQHVGARNLNRKISDVFAVFLSRVSRLI